MPNNPFEVLIASFKGVSRTQVRHLVQEIHAAGGTSPDRLARMLIEEDLPLETRLSICWLLPRLPVPETIRLLIKQLECAEESMRAEAALGLGLSLKAKDDISSLLKLLATETSEDVLSAILHALGIIGSPVSAAPIMQMLRSFSSAKIRSEAAEALAHVHGSGVVDELINALRDPSPLARYSSAYSLGQQGDRRAIPALRHLINVDFGATMWGSVSQAAHEAIRTIIIQTEESVE